MDDPHRAMLHGIVGGIIAEINGGNFGSGFSAGAINELVIGQIMEQMIDYKLKTGKDLLSNSELQWVASLVGGAIGGYEGAGIASGGVKHNEGDHPIVFKIDEKRVQLFLDGQVTDEDAAVLVAIYKDKTFDLNSGEQVRDMVRETQWSLERAKSNPITTEEQWQAAVAKMTPQELLISAASPFVVAGGIILIVEGAPVFIASGTSGYQAVQRFLNPPVREQLLKEVTNPKLRRIVNELYRPGAQVGNGGTADMIKHELAQYGSSPHLQKGVDRMNELAKGLRQGLFSGKDYEVAYKLLKELEAVVPKDLWQHIK